jgi:hypothetical protein
MVKLLVVFAFVLICAQANVFDFHANYVKRIRKASDAYVHLGDFTCPKYVCNSGTPYTDGTCVTNANSTYTL